MYVIDTFSLWITFHHKYNRECWTWEFLFYRLIVWYIIYICQQKVIKMSDKETKTKKIIKDLSDKIDELLEKSDISKDEVKTEIDRRIAELKKSRDQVNEEFKKIREENKETFDKVENLAKNTAKEVKSVFNDLFGSKSDSKSSKGGKEADPKK